MRHWGARSGMTLMELVIGLAITGMMAAAGAATFSSIIDHRVTVRGAAVSAERADAFRELIHSWIYGGTIQLQRGGGPRGLTRAAGGTIAGATNRSGMNNMSSQTAAQAAGDELAFTTQAVNPSMLGNVRIRLYIDADANTPESGLTIEYQPNAQLPLVRKMLDSTITSMTVEYLDMQTNRWHPSSETATITPKAVRLTFASSDSSRSRLFDLPMLFPIGNPTSQAFNFNNQ